MRFATALLIALLVSGCSHSVVAVNNNGPQTPPTTVTSGPNGLTINSGSAALLLFVLGMSAIEYSQNLQALPSPYDLVSTSRPTPELAADRRVNEQDCSKPVDLSAGNLRCK